MGVRTLAIWFLSLATGLLIGTTLAPSPAGVPPASRQAPHSAPGAKGEVTEAPARPAPPAPMDGDGRIVGTVHLEDGTPLAGVMVIACRDAPQDENTWHYRPQPVSSEGLPDLHREQEGYFAEMMKDHRYRAATRRDGISGDDGRFEIRGLGEGGCMIEAFREGYDIRMAGTDRWYRPGETVDLIARPVIRLPVTVLNPDGSTAAAAEIRMEGGFEHAVAWSPEHDLVDVPAETVTLTAHARGDRLKSQPQTVEVSATAPAERIVLTLAGIQGIEGTVTFPRGARAPFYEVVALDLPPGASEDPERLREEGRRDRLFGLSRPAGVYTMADLAPGRYLIGVVHRRTGVLMSGIITTGPGLEVHDFVLPGAEVGAVDEPAAEPATAETLVRVVAPDGSPELWAMVRAVLKTASGGTRSAGRVEQVEPGAYRVFVTSPEPDGAYLVRVESEQYGEQEVPFHPATDREITVHLTEPAYVKVVVPHYAGSRFEGKTRILVDRPGKWNGYSGPVRTPPEPDGSQVFGPLPPGEWAVYLWYSTGSTPQLTRLVTLRSGTQEVSLDLPLLFNLDVQVEGIDAEQGYYLRRVDGQSGHSAAIVVRKGLIRFEGLKVGRYILSRHHGPRQHMALTITGDLTVSFVPVVLDALLVEVTDPAGALARNGLRQGDLILAVDKSKVTGSNYGWFMGQFRRGKRSAVLTIRRDGSEVELTVDPRRFTDPYRAGGELTPWRK